MEGRTTTPPIAVVKNEDESITHQEIIMSNTNAASPKSNPQSRPSTIVLPTSNPSNTPRTPIPSEIDIPVRFRYILDRTIRKHPVLVQKRYADFLEYETSAGNGPVQESDQIKL